MFFMRLRRNAKWVFVLLIVVFAFSFLFAGVGTGTGGADLIQGLLGLRGGNAIESAESDVKAHPKSVEALKNLASLYVTAKRNMDAVRTYEKALKLSPNNTGALSSLSSIWQGMTEARYERYLTLQAKLSAAEGPLGTNIFQPVLGSTSTDPLISEYTNGLTTKLIMAETSYTTAARSWEDAYSRYAKATPTTGAAARGQVEYNLAYAAEFANDIPTAIKSLKAAIKDYQSVLRSSPKNTQIKDAIAALQKELASLQKSSAGG
jgi:tetratricopeptide (TPR) repeat protein